MLKVEQFIDTEVKCAFSGDLQQSKLALNMCKTNPTNSHTETSTHGQSHQNIWGNFPFTWDCSFLTTLSSQKVFRLGCFDPCGWWVRLWKNILTTGLCHVPKDSLHSFLSNDLKQCLLCSNDGIKGSTALGSWRVMRYWNLCNTPRNTPWHSVVTKISGIKAPNIADHAMTIREL